MNMKPQQNFDEDLADLPVAASWATSVTEDLERSNRRAWIVAIIAAMIALLEAVALVFLLPLKTTVPFTLLVDRQTGNVEALAPMDAQVVAPDSALTRSFLVQYVTARESFALPTLQDDYRKVSLWSDGKVRDAYERAMNAATPNSPLAVLPRNASIRTEVKSVSNLGEGRALVRFQTTRIDPGASPQPPSHWAAIINYSFSAAEMTEEDRYTNPLGFQVTSYRRDAETIPEEGIVNGVDLDQTGRPAP
ncbi:virB8 family protein [Porphyrobacter sp. LM 6]|jgi:type IV secretion system protein VirB8|uniref:virB8 family protein n=1 Tax=Porphyrobacter sp. LM 6 TaxID=1896196 RepID=UPI0008469B86|nr:type IV secretion system protein [Porphyrobacter sp. LM 6]AOL95465.1 type IV secretion system protein VirB8 [Porphyrobacter sp. LM 6]